MIDKMKEDHSMQMAAVKKEVETCLNMARNGDEKGLQRFVEEYIAAHNSRDDRMTPERVLSSVKDGHGRCALHFACMEGQEGVVPYLLHTAPSTINVCDANGHTPLALSLMSGHLGIAQLLLDAGASPDEANEEGVTPLHKAAGFNDTKGIAILCKYGAKMDLQSKGGTPLHWAAGGGHADTVEALLSNGANPNTCNSEGITPLVMAVILGDEGSEAVDLIVNSKACTFTTVAQGLTALHISADIGCIKSVKILLTAEDADRAVSTLNSLGKLPIQLAAEAGHREVVQLLHECFPFQDTGGSEKRDMSVDEIMSMWFVNNVEEGQRAEEKGGEMDPLKSNGNVPTTGQAKVTPSNEERRLAKAAKEEGNALLKTKMYNDAIVAYTRAIELDGSNHIYWSNRSAVWMELNHYERALLDAETCASLAPEWPKACFRVATALLALKRHEDAAMVAWKGVQIDNDNPQLKELLKICVEEGRSCSKQQQQSSK